MNRLKIADKDWDNLKKGFEKVVVEFGGSFEDH